MKFKLNNIIKNIFLDYPFCIRLSQKVDGKVLVTFNARNEHDRCKFTDEMDEMEALRIEAELARQNVEVCPCPYQADQTNIVHTEQQLKRSVLSNSLLDMHEQCKFV